ncbi:MAG TPA: ATP-binding protein [Gemmatimonadaceae bacterium]|nr:ATP-binding protein [Gemmatimonadaceae bacterium]
MGETRVDLVHLLEDLADAYPGDLEETVLTEIVANALDSGASRIGITTDSESAALVILDDGSGMRRSELRRFHDVAASAKVRGEGIGFAGVGIKLGLLLSREVITETRRGRDHLATAWALSGRRRAPWRWIEPPGAVAEHGTAVRMALENALSPLLDVGYLETMLRRHFEPLFDPRFDEILRPHYPDGVSIDVNGSELTRNCAAAGDAAPVSVRLARKRKPSAWGYLERTGQAAEEGRRGLAISTCGKVIKRGWDWLGITPADPDRVSGLVEAPALAASLTLNKVDFFRSGPRGALYLAYRKALQEVVAEQLAAWGNARESDAGQRRRAARPVERDLERVLFDLADSFPMLATLVERRSGGQRSLPIGGSRPANDVPAELVATASPTPVAPDDENRTDEERAPSDTDATSSSPEEPRFTEMEPTVLDAPLSKRGPRRPTKLGLTIQFASRPDDPELGRLVETTVWVNVAHPAYLRALSSRSEGYHLALAVAMALAGVAVESRQERLFITEFLARWGDAANGKPGRASHGARRRAPL